MPSALTAVWKGSLETCKQNERTEEDLLTLDFFGSLSTSLKLNNFLTQGIDTCQKALLQRGERAAERGCKGSTVSWKAAVMH